MVESASTPARLMQRHAVDAPALGRLADGGVLTALVDACDAPGVPERVLGRGPGAGACLYQGAEMLAFRDRAPYLVRVDREVLTWIGGALAGTPWGAFTVSDAPFEAQLRHWRRWLTVTSPGAPPSGGEAWAFRFYDPRLAPVFLAGCTADEVAQFFGPVRSLVVPAGEGLAGEMLTPAAPAAGRPGTRRATGERFQLRTAHVAAFRRRSFGDALIASVNRESGATGQQAWRDPADQTTGDVLISGVASGGNPADVPAMRFGFGADGFLGAVTSPLGRRWAFASDEGGRPLHVSTPAGARVDLARDAARHVARVTRSGRSPSVGKGGTSVVVEVVNDEWGRPTAFRHADGTRAAVAYAQVGDAGVLDMAGQRPTVVTDRLGRTTRYAYDPDGDLTAVTDAMGRETRFVYGGWRRPDAVLYPGGRREEYAYGGDGQLAAITYGDGVVLHVACDDAGQLMSLVSAGGADVAPAHVTFARDPAGRVLEARTGVGLQHAPVERGNEILGSVRADALGASETEVRVGYDEVGRVVAETRALFTLGARVADEDVVRYAYDAQGTLLGLTYPTEETIAYAWDADGRLAGVTDWDGRRYAIEYAPGDRGWRLTDPGGVAHTVVQDAFGRPAAAVVHAPDAAGTPAARLVCRTALGYDAEDQVAAVDDTRLGAWRYAYDAEGQLTACDGPSGAETARYAYDPAGNRVAVAEGNGEATAAEIDAGDRLLRQGAVHLTYDACGRVVGRAEPDVVGDPARAGWAYAYDARGQLVRAEGPAADGVARRVLTFAYDAFGRRVEKVCVVRPPEAAPGAGVGLALGAREAVATRTRFAWAGEQCVREVVERAAWGAGDPAETVVPPGVAWRAAEARDYAYWPGTVMPLLLRVTTPGGDVLGAGLATYLYHCDHLGAPVRLTDAAGGVVWEAAYAPYGGTRITVEEVAQPWRRPGQYADGETGLYYNRLRMYDPRLGRYVTPDPMGLLGGSHAYRYAANAPTVNADPLGLWPSWGTVGRIAATVAVGVVAAVAVGALVVALAPIVAAGAAAATVAGVALVAAGAAAGAASMALNEAFETHFSCVACLMKAALKGAVVGAIAAAPFLWAPAGAGALTIAGFGAGSGAIGYIGDWMANGMDPAEWSWGWFAASVGIGAVTAGAGSRYASARKAAATRARVKANVAVSQAARESSNFGAHAAAEHAAATTPRTLKYRPSSGAALNTTPGQTTTVLGSYGQDMRHVVGELGNVKTTYSGPRPNGFNVLNVPDHFYKSPGQFWTEYNEPWLRTLVERGDPVVMATEPEFGPQSLLFREDRATGKLTLSGFGREYTYLRRNGYVYDPATKQMVKRP